VTPITKRRLHRSPEQTSAGVAMSTAIVREIILEEIAQSGRCHRYYVVERIKNRIHPTELYNKCLEDEKWHSTDGIKNMHHGAQMIYREAMRNMCRRFRVDKQGFIMAKQE
jgi:hypothetical protein